MDKEFVFDGFPIYVTRSQAKDTIYLVPPTMLGLLGIANHSQILSVDGGWLRNRCARIMDFGDCHTSGGLFATEKTMARMNFGGALERLKAGAAVTRLGWNGKGQYIMLQIPDAASVMNTLPYLWIRTVKRDRVPWLASQTDMLADDWVEVEL